MCVRNIGNNDKGVPRSLGAHGQGAVWGPLTTPLSALMSFSPLHRAPEPSGPLDFVHPVLPLATPLNNDDSPKILSCHQCNKVFKSQTSLQKHVNNHEHNRKRETEMCMYCDMKLKGKLSLTVHKKRHRGETPFECKQCLEKFSSREELTQHRTSHVDKKALSCHQCNKALKSRKNLLMHIKNCECNKQGEMVCLYCDRKVKGKVGLASHMKTHVGETPFECLQCGDEFASREELTQHRTNHVDDKIALKCHHCVTTFPSLLKLQRHLGEISTGFKRTRSKCNKCGKGFASNYRRDIHMREAHTGEDIFRCTNCGKKFLQESELSQHVETGCQSLKCHECYKFFKRKSFLKDHIISMHPKEKPPHLQHVECKYCLKSLSSERQLQRHIKSIHEIDVSKCEFCEKIFTLEEYLRKHIKNRHPDTLQYKCTHCGHKVSTSRHLAAHITLKHSATETSGTNEKHLCSYCGKCFSKMYQLKRHQEIHAVNKPYLCPSCGRRFSTDSGLKSHLRTHDGKKEYQCNLCGKGFVHRYSLTSHMKNNHKDKDEMRLISCI
ncbi:zinc finger protein 711-like [Amphiura filiformis]|uniref:zinc finger protein 711-like n=1 Tax=Amphiura filiformis TaxID=82378 RepID=UPI003B21DBF9